MNNSEPTLTTKFRNVGDWLATELECPFCKSKDNVDGQSATSGVGMRAGGEHDYCCMTCGQAVPAEMLLEEL